GEQHPPFWRDKVVVIGGAVPTLILIVFFGYLFWASIQAHAKQLVIVSAAVPTLIFVVFLGFSSWPQICQAIKTSQPATALINTARGFTQPRKVVPTRRVRPSKPMRPAVIRHVGPRGGYYYYSGTGRKVYKRFWWI